MYVNVTGVNQWNNPFRLINIPYSREEHKLNFFFKESHVNMCVLIK